MKIKDIIIEHEFPNIKRSTRPGELPDLYDYDSMFSDHDHKYDVRDVTQFKPSSARVVKLGTGAFATAYQDKDNPHDVLKGSKETTLSDGFKIFFIALSKDTKMQANPYFPRFRAIRQFDSADKQRSNYIVRMEKLEDIKSINRAEAKAILRKLFSEQTQKSIINIATFEEGMRYSSDAQNCVFAGISLALDRASVRRNIIDKNFLQAVEFINKIADDFEYYADLHKGNIMIRRTQYGVQPVINDPLGMSLDHKDS